MVIDKQECDATYERLANRLRLRCALWALMYKTWVVIGANKCHIHIHIAHIATCYCLKLRTRSLQTIQYFATASLLSQASCRLWLLHENNCMCNDAFHCEYGKCENGIADICTVSLLPMLESWVVEYHLPFVTAYESSKYVLCCSNKRVLKYLLALTVFIFQDFRLVQLSKMWPIAWTIRQYRFWSDRN